MTTAHIAAPVAEAPRGQRTSTARQERASRSAFLAILADRRLSYFDRAILWALADFCWAEGNAFAFPPSEEIAQLVGAAGGSDGGLAVVNRSLAKMERLGILERIAWYEVDEFMESVGRPRLGLRDPRERSRNSRRYLLLWWKVPGTSECLAVPLRRAAPPSARVQVDARVPSAGAHPHMTQESSGRMTPESSSSYCSKFNSKSLNSNSEEFAGARRRPEEDDPVAARFPIPDGEDAPAAPGPPPIPAAEPPGLTAGQVAAIEALAPEQREKLREWGPRKRAEFLEPHARGLDRKLLAWQAAKELAGPRAAPLPDASTPTPELIRFLTGHQGPSLAARCTRAIMLDLDDRGGHRSFEVIYRLCAEVVRGALDPDSLAVPLANTLDAIRSGMKIENPAGYWMRGVQNRVRERPPE